jgi:hypothetical protein
MASSHVYLCALMFLDTKRHIFHYYVWKDTCKGNDAATIVKKFGAIDSLGQTLEEIENLGTRDRIEEASHSNKQVGVCMLWWPYMDITMVIFLEFFRYKKIHKIRNIEIIKIRIHLFKTIIINPSKIKKSNQNCG